MMDGMAGMEAWRHMDDDVAEAEAARLRGDWRMPGIRPDWWIRKMAEEHAMIEPFMPFKKRENPDGEGIISYGLSSYGYDIRAGKGFFIAKDGQRVDPKCQQEDALEYAEGEVWLPAGTVALTTIVEYFRMPESVTGLVACKSTYARTGVTIPTVVLEAGWRGTITLLIINNAPGPVRIYANEGIAQVLFFEGMRCEADYAARGAKYQGDKGITLGKV